MMAFVRAICFSSICAPPSVTPATFRITGLCQSACTTFLSIKNVCVERSANFEFHAGSDGALPEKASSRA